MFARDSVFADLWVYVCSELGVSGLLLFGFVCLGDCVCLCVCVFVFVQYVLCVRVCGLWVCCLSCVCVCRFVGLRWVCTFLRRMVGVFWGGRESTYAI